MNGSAMLLRGVKSACPNVCEAEHTMKMSWLLWVFWPITHPLKTILTPGGITGRWFPKKEGNRRQGKDEGSTDENSQSSREDK